MSDCSSNCPSDSWEPGHLDDDIPTTPPLSPRPVEHQAHGEDNIEFHEREAVFPATRRLNRWQQQQQQQPPRRVKLEFPRIEAFSMTILIDIIAVTLRMNIRVADLIYDVVLFAFLSYNWPIWFCVIFMLACNIPAIMHHYNHTRENRF